MAEVTTELAGPESLTPVKAKRLSERIRDQVVKVEGEQGTLRKLLVEFNDGKGWKVLGHKKWEDWATQVIPGHRSTLYRQLSAGQHEAALGIEVGSTPESHLRDLNKVPAEDRKKVLNVADKLAEKEGRERQAADVKAAVAEVVPAAAPAQAEVQAAALTDSVGVEIPAALLPVFQQGKASFDEGMRLLTQLKAVVSEMANGKASRFIGTQLASLEQDRLNMYAAIKFGRPYAVCPYCKGQKKSCKACGDPKDGSDPTGWVNEAIWKASPTGKKAENANGKAKAKPKAAAG